MIELRTVLRPVKCTVVLIIKEFYENSVEFVNHQAIFPDAVICATGYQFGLEPLVGHFGGLDHRGSLKFYADQSRGKHTRQCFFDPTLHIWQHVYSSTRIEKINVDIIL